MKANLFIENECMSILGRVEKMRDHSGTNLIKYIWLKDEDNPAVKVQVYVVAENYKGNFEADFENSGKVTCINDLVLV